MAEVRTLDPIQMTGDDINDLEELEDETKVYEVSFHIVPSLSPEDAKAEFESIKKMIGDKEEASIIAEGQPALRTLAYTLSKMVKAVKSKYNQAHFGWVKFIAHPHDIESIKKDMDSRDSIIRYLIVSTVKENTMINREEEEQVAEEGAKEEELDRTIDELVVQ